MVCLPKWGVSECTKPKGFFLKSTVMYCHIATTADVFAPHILAWQWGILRRKAIQGSCSSDGLSWLMLGWSQPDICWIRMERCSMYCTACKARWRKAFEMESKRLLQKQLPARETERFVFPFVCALKFLMVGWYKLCYSFCKRLVIPSQPYLQWSLHPLQRFPLIRLV